jgi:hypothetical protein
MPKLTRPAHIPRWLELAASAVEGRTGRDLWSFTDRERAAIINAALDAGENATDKEIEDAAGDEAVGTMRQRPRRKRR